MYIIRSNNDLTTNYFYTYTKPVIALAKRKGLTVTLIEGEDINESNLCKRFKKRKAKLIFFNGHGSKDSLYDAFKRPFITTKTSSLLKDTITFARACDALVILGKESVDEGCKAFIGYKKKFIFPRYHKTTCTPEKDPSAKPALECSNLIMEELIKGKTVHESINSSHDKAVDYILDLIYSKEPWAGAALQAVSHNDKALSFEGDGSSSI